MSHFMLHLSKEGLCNTAMVAVKHQPINQSY